MAAAKRKKASAAVTPPTSPPPTSESLIADTRRPIPRGEMQVYTLDVLAGRKGLQIYEEMRTTDPLIRGCLEMRINAILAPGYKLEAANQSDAAKELAKQISGDLDDLDVPFHVSLRDALSCFSMGFSVSELCWNVEGRVKLRAIKAKYPQDLTFSQDEYGNLKEVLQLAPGGQISLPPNRILHLAHNGTFSNPFGVSDLRACHRLWWTRNNFLQYLSLHGESLGSPPVWASHPNTMSRDAVSKLLAVLSRLQARSSLAVPDGTSLHLLETAHNANDFFIGAMSWFDTAISRSLGIPDLSGMAGSKSSGGSYSLGAVQMNAWYLSLDALSKWLESEVQRQVIRRMCMWAGWDQPAFQDPANWPTINLLPAERSTRVEIAETWVKLVAAGSVTPTDQDEAHLRELLSFPGASSGTPLPSRNEPPTDASRIAPPRLLLPK
jgi:phage gp29-like protein